MSSESEMKQYAMDSGCGEEQIGDDSEIFKDKTTVKEEDATSKEGEDATYEEGKDATSKEEDAKSEAKEHSTSYSKNALVYLDDDIPAKSKSKLSIKEKNLSSEPEKSWKITLLEEYERLKGKSLSVCVPKATEKICNLIIGVRRTENNKARQYYLDFHSTEDRTEALKELRKVKIDGEKLRISIPKIEKEKYLAKLIERKRIKVARKARYKLYRAAREAAKEADNIKKETGAPQLERTCTSLITVQNSPESTVSDIKNIFPNTVDVNVNFSEGSENTTSATVTAPTPQDSTVARQKIYKNNENELKLSFEHGSPNSKGKRKLEEPPSIEFPSPKKKKNNVSINNEKEKQIPQQKNLEKVKSKLKMKLKKKLDSMKGANKVDKKYTEPMIKEIKKEKGIEEIDKNLIAVIEKKSKKEKPGKPLGNRKPKAK